MHTNENGRLIKQIPTQEALTSLFHVSYRTFKNVLMFI